MGLGAPIPGFRAVAERLEAMLTAGRGDLDYAALVTLLEDEAGVALAPRAVKRELPGGFELDDDPARVDLDAVWAFLSTEAYWGRERSREVVERQVRGGRAGDRPVPRGSAGRVRPGAERRDGSRTWPTCTCSPTTGVAVSASSSSAQRSTRVRIATCAGCSTRRTPTACTRSSGSARRATDCWSARSAAGLGRALGASRGRPARTARPTHPVPRSPCTGPSRMATASTRSRPVGRR